VPMTENLESDIEEPANLRAWLAAMCISRSPHELVA